eukprot:TRINITY_DN12232_c0_g1_i2.p1 TRINITY_DN12232_c0_g1~~TRINITY_DN12232_c0_g1_i2.p1  ORF type:complete len:766 (+),score=212.11 TRINITY_DN12232_c0_g1_i2:103-2298(+)
MVALDPLLHEWVASRALSADRRERIARGELRYEARDELSALRAELRLLAEADALCEKKRVQEQQQQQAEVPAESLSTDLPAPQHADPVEQLAEEPLTLPVCPEASAEADPCQLLQGAQWHPSAAAALPRYPRARLPHGAAAVVVRREDAAGVAVGAPRYAVAHAGAVCRAACASAAAAQRAVWLEVVPKGLPVHPYLILAPPPGSRPCGGEEAEVAAAALEAFEQTAGQLLPAEYVEPCGLSIVRCGAQLHLRWRLRCRDTGALRPFANTGEWGSVCFAMVHKLRTEHPVISEWFELPSVTAPCPELALPGPCSPCVLGRLSWECAELQALAGRWGAHSDCAECCPSPLGPAAAAELLATAHPPDRPPPQPDPDADHWELDPERPLRCSSRATATLPERLTVRADCAVSRAAVADLGHGAQPWAQSSVLSGDLAADAERRHAAWRQALRDAAAAALRRCEDPSQVRAAIATPSSERGSRRRTRASVAAPRGGGLSPEHMPSAPYLARRASSRRPTQQLTDTLASKREQRRRASERKQVRKQKRTAAVAQAVRAQERMLPSLSPEEQAQVLRGTRARHRLAVRAVQRELMLESDRQAMEEHDALSSAEEDVRRDRDRRRLCELRSELQGRAAEARRRRESDLRRAQLDADVDRARARQAAYVCRVRAKLELAQTADATALLEQEERRRRRQAEEEQAARKRQADLQLEADMRREAARLEVDLGCFVTEDRHP